MDDCVFCRIIEGKAEGTILYRDEKCLVILDKFPISKGHMLVISREHYNDILSAPDDIVAHMFLKAKEFATAAEEKLNANGINIGANIGALAGQIIWHAHIHVIPRYKGESRDFNFKTKNALDAKEAEGLKRLLGR